MASLRDLVKGDGDDPGVLAKAIPELLRLYPLVGEMLTGVPKSGSDAALPKYYISFSLETDGIVCRCTQKGSDESLYVKIGDALTPWQCLEAGLVSGQYTRRKNSVRTPTY